MWASRARVRGAHLHSPRLTGTAPARLPAKKRWSLGERARQQSTPRRRYGGDQKVSKVDSAARHGGSLIGNARKGKESELRWGPARTPGSSTDRRRQSSPPKSPPGGSRPLSHAAHLPRSPSGDKRGRGNDATPEWCRAGDPLPRAQHGLKEELYNTTEYLATAAQIRFGLTKPDLRRFEG